MAGRQVNIEFITILEGNWNVAAVGTFQAVLYRCKETGTVVWGIEMPVVQTLYNFVQHSNGWCQYTTFCTKLYGEVSNLKLFLYAPWTHMGIWGEAPLLLKLGTMGGLVVSFKLRLLCPRKQIPRYPLNKSRSWHFEEETDFFTQMGVKPGSLGRRYAHCVSCSLCTKIISSPRLGYLLRIEVALYVIIS